MSNTLEAPYLVYASLLESLGYGLPLYDPYVVGGVRLGDVGYLQFGKFNVLFNLFAKDADESAIPEGFVALENNENDNPSKDEQTTSGVLCSLNVDKLILDAEGNSQTR